MSTLAAALPRARRWLGRREAVLVAVLVVECLALSRMSPYFLTVSNLLGTTRIFTETALIALGMTLVIVSGGIDLSVGSLLALVSITVGFGFAGGIPMPAAIALAVVVGTLGGAMNGALVSYARLSPLAVTLGTFSLFRGLAYAVTGAHSVSTFPAWFAYLGQYYLGPIPGQLMVLAVAVAVVAVLLTRTTFGRYLYAFGCNETTARFSGVPVARLKLAIYAVTGLLVGIAGVVYTSRVSTARADAGLGLELNVIAAVVLGGASIYGGKGTVAGTALGVVILSLLSNGLTLANVPDTWSQVASGAVLVVTVFLNERFRKVDA